MWQRDGKHTGSQAGAGSVAFGNNARGETDAVAVGLNAQARSRSVVVDANTKNTEDPENDIGSSAVVIGTNSQVAGIRGVAIGERSQTGTDGVAIGGTAVANGALPVAIGANASATHMQSIALGFGSTADDVGLLDSSFLTGNVATGELSIGEKFSPDFPMTTPRIRGVADGAADTDAATVRHPRHERGRWPSATDAVNRRQLD